MIYAGIIAGVLLLVLLIYFVIIYNGFITLRNDIARSRSNIDVLLKQRHDELPNLVEVCRGFMAHERALLENVIKARNLYQPGDDARHTTAADLLLSKAIGNLFAVAEKYPNLKANQSFLKLQNRITQLENEIADRRELFNDCVTNYNTRLDQIPDVFVSRPLNFVAYPLWRLSDAERNADVRELVRELS